MPFLPARTYTAGRTPDKEKCTALAIFPPVLRLLYPDDNIASQHGSDRGGGRSPVPRTAALSAAAPPGARPPPTDQRPTGRSPITPAARSAAIVSLPRPSSSRSTSSLCWPRVGAGERYQPPVSAENRIARPGSSG